MQQKSSHEANKNYRSGETSSTRNISHVLFKCNVDQSQDVIFFSNFEVSRGFQETNTIKAKVPPDLNLDERRICELRGVTFSSPRVLRDHRWRFILFICVLFSIDS